MIQLIRGFKDILPGEAELWQEIERVSRDLFESFGFKEIRIPVMEKTELFARSIGEHTDIVEKEMYTFPDRKGDLITLRPEATASIVRSYVQHKMYAADPVRKFYTIGPMFRRERPQKGRYRQFYQINAEVIGVDAPYIDAQLIFLLATLLERLKVTDVAAHINSLGCPECRPAFREALTALLDGKKERLCEDCARRSGTNPLRVLDCKVPACREAMADAPSLLEYLCEGCKAHFDSVQRSLNRLGVPFVIDKKLVRGLDYYTRTTFEIQTGALGAQSAVAGGGRYDGLIKMLDGPDTPAIGFAIGLDRLAEIVGLRQADLEKKPRLFIAALGDACAEKAFDWICRLGLAGVHAEMDMADRSLKSQMKQADRCGADLVLILGESELASGSAVLRNMRTKEQAAVVIDDQTAARLLAHIQ
ncbi:histidine--tRNA ligase [Desulfococcus sp.]|uniref:histidine--tRNA ligase n=1 Tax=Desulfococcus sp. TaxID=2025834 RepID=UPI0035946268